jgi:hypothetical protein
MTKEEIIKKHKQYLFPSINTYYTEPLVTDHGSMQHLWDVDGNKYLDFFGGIVTISVGHANPRITSKIKAQTIRFPRITISGFGSGRALVPSMSERARTITVCVAMLAAGVAVESCALHRRARHKAMAPRQPMGRMQRLPL